MWSQTCLHMMQRLSRPSSRRRNAQETHRTCNGDERVCQQCSHKPRMCDAVPAVAALLFLIIKRLIVHTQGLHGRGFRRECVRACAGGGGVEVVTATLVQELPKQRTQCWSLWRTVCPPHLMTTWVHRPYCGVLSAHEARLQWLGGRHVEWEDETLRKTQHTEKRYRRLCCAC
jgi:hypothetical protein